MEQRISVVARKYTLKTKKNRVWDKNCRARVDGGLKVYSTEFIESMNIVDNNIYYVIDEEATEKYLKDLEVRIAKARERKALSAMSPTDILRESLNASKQSSGSQDAKKTEIEKLRAQCDAKQIEYSSRAGVKKLTELLNQEK